MTLLTERLFREWDLFAPMNFDAKFGANKRKDHD